MNAWLSARLACLPTLASSAIDGAAAASILVQGDARLRAVNAPVSDPLAADFQLHKLRLHRALRDFRLAHGYGRSLAAPQIGVNSRFLAVNLGSGFFSMINPQIVWRSADTFTLWDDCLSLPQLLVKKRRSSSISLTFVDDQGAHHHWDNCPRDVSELLQHEVDHLDGVLATDQPEGPLRDAFVFRSAYDSDPDYFHRQVDYHIVPT